MFCNRYCSNIQDFQKMIRRIFGICRLPCFPTCYFFWFSNILRFPKVIRHPPYLRALLECTDVEKQPLERMLSCLKGQPPQYSHIPAYTRVHPHDLVRLFLMSKNQAHKLQNGESLGDTKITKKTTKIRSGMESGKDCEKYWKVEALEPWQSWFSLGRLLKMLLPSCSKKTLQIKPNMCSKWYRN